MITIMSDDIVSVVASHARRARCLDKGAYLFHQGDAVKSVFVVTKGSIELMRFHEEGNSLVLQRAGAATFLAEASVYSQFYHCDAVVSETCVVREMSRSAFLAMLAERPETYELWAGHLARQVQAARYRSEILTRRSVSGRLDGWLAWKDGRLPAKGQWKSVAEEIGVSAEALYRELARRRKRRT